MWIEKLNKLNPKKGESISIQIRVMRPEAETNKIACIKSKENSDFSLDPLTLRMPYSWKRVKKEPVREWKKFIRPTNSTNTPVINVIHAK